MENETAIEKTIKCFVFDKIQEQVYLNVSKSKTISIKHQSKHGSIALAMFWLRVMRHQNNYPMPKYPYKEIYDKQGNNKVILKVDDVTLTTFLTTGTLMMQGTFVLEWFLNTFQTIMEAYDAEIREPKPQTTVYRQYTENWKKLQDEDKDKRRQEEEAVKKKEDHALEVVGDRAVIITELGARGDMSAADGSMDDTATDGQRESAKLQEAADTAAEELAEELELMTIDVWPEDVLTTQLNKLRMCSVRDGSTYVYRLWKSLLNHWLSDPLRKVYLVSPFLDTTRLVDVCQIILDHRIEANLDAFYVRQACDHDKKIFEVKRDALRKFDAKDQMFLEYKVYSSIIYPLKTFHAKFIASVKGEEAEVLVTSANFHGNHFECSNMETVFYQTMSDVEFVRGFLSPIIASVQVQK